MRSVDQEEFVVGRSLLTRLDREDHAQAGATSGCPGDKRVPAVRLDGVDTRPGGRFEQSSRALVDGDEDGRHLGQGGETADLVEFPMTHRRLPVDETDGVGACLDRGLDVLGCVESADLHEHPVGLPSRHALNSSIRAAGSSAFTSASPTRTASYPAAAILLASAPTKMPDSATVTSTSARSGATFSAVARSTEKSLRSRLFTPTISAPASTARRASSVSWTSTRASNPTSVADPIRSVSWASSRAATINSTAEAPQLR